MKKILSISLILSLLISTFAYATIKVDDYNLQRYYAKGDVVKNNGKYYQCVEHDNTNQCNFGEDYAPGVWPLWDRTWMVVDATSLNVVNTNNTQTGSNMVVLDLSKIPGTPKISNLPRTLATGNFTLNWWIENNENPGTILKLSENNVFVKTVFAATGESFSHGDMAINGKKDGIYNYAIFLCNKSGSEKCAKGNTLTMTVKGSGNTSTTTTTTTPTTTTTTNTTNSGSTTTSSTVDRSKVPTFEKLPRDSSFDDFGRALEIKLRSEIRTKQLNAQRVKDYISVVSDWINFLKSLNSKGQLTGQEKRSLIILQMIRDILQKLS